MKLLKEKYFNNPNGYIKYCLLIILLTIPVTLFINTKHINNKSKMASLNSLKEFNSSLERIESYLEIKDIDKVCKESLFAKNKILTNLNLLKKVEPYYDWHEIKKVLGLISKKFCKQ